jgi:hypothetical protein
MAEGEKGKGKKGRKRKKRRAKREAVVVFSFLFVLLFISPLFVNNNNINVNNLNSNASGEMEAVTTVERLMGGFHGMHVERVLRESHEYGDLVVLARLPGVATTTDDGDDPDLLARRRAVVVFKSHETLLQPRHVASILQPSTALQLLSHNDVFVKFFFYYFI